MPNAATHTADTGFAWAVKRSFVGYVSAVPDGRTLVGEGAAITSDSDFHFPFSHASESEPGAMSLHFAGVVAFTAHHGMLTVSLRRPRLALSGTGGRLLIASTGGEVPIARLVLPDAHTARDVTTWSDVPTTLTREGSAVFGGFYAEGEELAPLTIRIPASARMPAAR